MRFSVGSLFTIAVLLLVSITVVLEGPDRQHRANSFCTGCLGKSCIPEGLTVWMEKAGNGWGEDSSFTCSAGQDGAAVGCVSSVVQRD